MKRLWLLYVVAGLAFVALLTGKEFLDVSVISRIAGPLVVVCILLWVYLTRRGDSVVTRRLLFVALSLSATADVLTGWGTDLTFVAGMGLFIVVQALLAVLFVRRGGWSYRLVIPVIAFGCLSIAITGGFLWSHLHGVMLVAIPLYLVVLTMMVALAWSVWLRGRTMYPLVAAIGALLFYVSDTLIALDKFGGIHVPLSDVWILLSYWAALTLIAFSFPPTPYSTRGVR